MNEFSKFKDWAVCIIAVIIFYGNIMVLAANVLQITNILCVM